MAPNRHERTLGVSPYPFNFSSLREGDADPVLGKTVKWLIDSDDDYIVYIDEENYVEWTMNSNDRLPNAGPLLTKVGWLEAADDEHLDESQIETYKRLIGEGVARLFDRNLVAAEAALTAAQLWISARAAEASRRWLLEGATGASMLVAVVYYLFYRKLGGLELLLHGRFEAVTGAAFGGLGAWLSVVQRSGSENLDLGAGAKIRRLEGLSRVLIGAIGGLFVALLAISGYLAPTLTANRAFFIAVCLVAGLSERMVNSLATGIETSAALRLPQAQHPSADGVARETRADGAVDDEAAAGKQGAVAAPALDPTNPVWGPPVPPP
jgi:hypothetical protein